MIKYRLSLLLLFISAAITSAMALGSGTSARGNIFLRDGSQLDSVRFEMPLNMDEKVKISIDGKKHKFETDSIDYIILWHEKHPDMKYLFKPFHCQFMNIDTGEDLGISDSHIWLCLEQMGDHASYWQLIGRPDFKKGKIRFNYNYYRSYKSTVYILKHDSENPCKTPDSTKDKKKWIRVYFNDDPDVIRKLEAMRHSPTLRPQLRKLFP